jgi:hypothetical protein
VSVSCTLTPTLTFRDAVHPENIHIRGFPARLGERHLVDGFLVDLIAMDDQAARGAELLSTQIALEMLQMRTHNMRVECDK